MSSPYTIGETAGYRLYDADAITRLAFIAHAKQLGCRLEEIGHLVTMLHDAAAHLEGPATDGPCSAGCACMTTYDRDAPIACTASGEELSGRIEHGLLLSFPNESDVGADVRAFTVDEKRCYTFWGFEVSTQDDRLTLRRDGPPDVRDLFDDLVEFFEGDQRRTG